MKILVTGATGFIGKKLISALIAKNHSVAVLSRNPKKAVATLGPLVKTYAWNAEKEEPPVESLKECEAIIHLAGESIASGRWTEEVKKKIMDSRVIGTRFLVNGVNRLSESERPKVFLSASAIGIYGDQGEQALDEDGPHGKGFLVQVCEAWENEASAVKTSRKAVIRVGVVLGKKGGALEKMLPPFKWGLGGKIGDGKQFMSWIHLDDLVALFVQVIENSHMTGVFNGVSPEPVRNEVFTHELGAALHRPTFFTIPEIALTLLYGEMANEALFASQRVEPSRTLESGFHFKFPDLSEALKDILA